MRAGSWYPGWIPRAESNLYLTGTRALGKIMFDFAAKRPSCRNLWRREPLLLPGKKEMSCVTIACGPGVAHWVAWRAVKWPSRRSLAREGVFFFRQGLFRIPTQQRLATHLE